MLHDLKIFLPEWKHLHSAVQVRLDVYTEIWNAQQVCQKGKIWRSGDNTVTPGGRKHNWQFFLYKPITIC